MSEDERSRVAEIMQNVPAAELHGRDWTKATFYKSDGCETCQGLGYKGRIGIYEVMAMNAEIEKFIQAGKVSEFDIRALAVQNGMATMAQDGIIKAMAGITSVDEVLRVAE